MNLSNYTKQAVKGVKEVVVQAMPNLVDYLMDNRVISFEMTSEADEIFNSLEGMSGVTDLGEEEVPPSLALEEGYQITLSPTRFGAAIIVPERTYKIDAKDNTTVIDKYLLEQRDALLGSIKKKLLIKGFYMLNNGHNSSALTLAPDDVELFGAHTFQSGATFDNSATAALDADAVDDMEEFGGRFSDPTNTEDPWAHDYNVITVKQGTDNARMAKRMFAYGINPISIADVNIYQGSKTIIEVQHITYTNKNYWSARDDSFPNSIYVGINSTPGINDPIVETNQAIRSNATGFAKRGIRFLPHEAYGSQGTT